ncbi:hypothetical protein M0802_011799 [Mischocyttarus mexicanus]|nr:hypothetical protein M0802_011799 [Mischocyttarus mexicanus]
MSYAVEIRAEKMQLPRGLLRNTETKTLRTLPRGLLRNTETKTLRTVTDKTLFNQQCNDDVWRECNIQDIVRWV